jgi:hypothetical protein
MNYIKILGLFLESHRKNKRKERKMSICLVQPNWFLQPKRKKKKPKNRVVVRIPTILYGF